MRVWPDLPIRTERLTLRPVDIVDAYQIARAISSKDMVMYTLMIPFPYSVEDSIHFIMESKRALNEGTALNLAIVPQDLGELIGVMGLMGLEPKYRKASIGYWLSKRYWGNGYVPEALNALSDYAFGPLGLHRLEAQIFEANIRSKRALEKAHFRYEGLMRDRYVRDGQTFNALMFSRLSTDLLPPY